ncbi:MAG: c-type cytochrome [Sulfurospirillaceae bacterium]|nr:c-type cytochrome [Sulfurospirillaceae bacterium]
MYKSILNFLFLLSSVAFVSSINAQTLSYTPANPDKYPFPDVTTNKKGQKIGIDGAIILKPVVKVNSVYKSQFSGKNFALGTKATKEQVKAWNTDVRPDGKGLPDGSMTVAKGAAVFQAKCASCHGDFGEGVDRFPVLAGGIGTLKLHPKTGGDPGPLKTIGSYLPYIAPLYWYVQTAMPLSAPKSLSNSEVYGILGYILQLNEIQVNGKDIEDSTVIDRKFIKAVHLPNEKGFEYNNLRKPDTHNTRCMKNCINPSKMTVMHIKTDATQVDPGFGNGRYYFPDNTKKAKESANDIGKKVYENTCAGCHSSGIAGAPVFGDKKAWAKVLKLDMKTIFSHAINGFNAMPAKGGDASLSNKQVEDAVKYMIDKSK